MAEITNTINPLIYLFSQAYTSRSAFLSAFINGFHTCFKIRYNNDTVKYFEAADMDQTFSNVREYVWLTPIANLYRLDDESALEGYVYRKGNDDLGNNPVSIIDGKVTHGKLATLGRYGAESKTIEAFLDTDCGADENAGYRYSSPQQPSNLRNPTKLQATGRYDCLYEDFTKEISTDSIHITINKNERAITINNKTYHYPDGSALVYVERKSTFSDFTIDATNLETVEKEITDANKTRQIENYNNNGALSYSGITYFDYYGAKLYLFGLTERSIIQSSGITITKVRPQPKMEIDCPTLKYIDLLKTATTEIQISPTTTLSYSMYLQNLYGSMFEQLGQWRASNNPLNFNLMSVNSNKSYSKHTDGIYNSAVCIDTDVLLTYSLPELSRIYQFHSYPLTAEISINNYGTIECDNLNSPILFERNASQYTNMVRQVENDSYTAGKLIGEYRTKPGIMPLGFDVTSSTPIYSANQFYSKSLPYWSYTDMFHEETYSTGVIVSYTENFAWAMGYQNKYKENLTVAHAIYLVYNVYPNN